MIGYILRRVLYGIPIIIGVNVIVFALFFFVYTPDQVARAHIGHKRATPELIDEWKRERSLDLPYFYDTGWRQIGSVQADDEKNEKMVPTARAGIYRLIIQTPENEKDARERTLTVQLERDPERLALPTGFDATGAIALPQDNLPRHFDFEIKPPAALPNGADGKEAEPPTLKISFNLSQPMAMHRVLIEYQTAPALAAPFTNTIFYQRSVKTLFFNYGKSDDGKEISREVLKRIVPSLTITIPAFIVALFLDIFFSMILAYYRATYVDYWGVILCVLAMSISFMFYIMGAQLLIGRYLRLSPISGYDYGWHSLKFMLLPVFVSVIGGLGGGIRFNRTIFLEEINKDYVRTAQAKGLASSVVLFVHVLKNAMLPILTGLVAGLPFLIMGGLVTESFFAIPGMGAYTLDAIQQQDFAIVQAMVMLGSFLYIIGLIMTDISYTLVDPRIRLQ